MQDKDKPTEASAVELSESALETVQGGTGYDPDKGNGGVMARRGVGPKLPQDKEGYIGETEKN